MFMFLLMGGRRVKIFKDKDVFPSFRPCGRRIKADYESDLLKAFRLFCKEKSEEFYQKAKEIYEGGI